MVQILVALALAVTPTSDTYDGIEPQRLLVQHDSEQARFLGGAAWKAFERTDGAGWTARFDEATHTPRWAWGRGIPLPDGEAELHEALTGLLDRHAVLFGFEAGTLRVKSSVVDGDTRYVELVAPRAGLETYRGGISARIKHGNLVYLRIGTAPDAPVTGSFALDGDAAAAEAVAQGPAPKAIHEDLAAEPILLEQRGLFGHELRVTWMVTSRTAEPVGKWTSFVDAETGALLSVHNGVLFTAGTVTARHHRRSPDGSNLVVSPLPSVVVNGATDGATTDENGDFTLTGNGPFRTSFDGQYANVFNGAGGEGSLQDSNASGLEWTSQDASQAEIDTYKFLTDVKAWGERYAPTVGWVANPIRATVNLNQTCNAYWDGEVHFFSSGGGCNNTGQIADVVYHEWGHGFHDGSIRTGRFDGSLSEGAGDVVAVLQTSDPAMAPDFFTNGGTIRNLGPDKRYPQDMVGEVHENGLIFGGAMYDLLVILDGEVGAAAANTAVSEIFAGLLKGGPDIADSFYEALVADDDDGSLENGTPHVCELYEAFGRHGLGTQTGASVVLATHDALVRVDPMARMPVSVDLVSVAAGCEAVRADTAVVHWRAGKGAWQTTPMTASGPGATGEIPPQQAGTIVEYYITGTADGGQFEAPLGGDIHPYTVYVGGVLPIRCDDFEADDAGYTHQLLSGTAGDGADDWQWGAPNGAAGDPSGAFSGNKVWGTDLGQDGWNGTYQANKHTRLTSARFETRWYEGVVLNYRRWLGVEDSTYDRATVSIDGDILWENHASAGGEQNHADGEWASHTVDLQGMADRRSVSVAWDISSDQGLELGGWTIDDVCLFAPATADNRLGIDDLRIEAQGATTALLRWTQPRHDPVVAIRIVRRTDRMPAGADDGQIAYESDDIELGRPVQLELESYHAGTTYYAVYGFDGDDWLSWTIDGWNAGAVELAGGAPPDGVMTEDGMIVGDPTSAGYQRLGCACDAGGNPGGGLLALGLLALAARRRR